MDRKVVSHSQVVELLGIGKLSALLDTGNGASSCSVNSSMIKDDGDTVTWTCEGQEMTHDVVDRIQVKAGRGVEERPVILLDLIICGTKVPNVRFSPVDRSNKSYQVLINRKVLSDLNLGVMTNESMKVLKFDDFSKLYEANKISVGEPVGIAVLGVPAGGKSYTLNKLKDATDDARLTKTLAKGVNLSVDVLRNEFQSKDPMDQITGFIGAFYLFRDKAKVDNQEFGKWFSDIKSLWNDKLSKILPDLKITADDENIYLNEVPIPSSIKSFTKEDAEKAVPALDRYNDYKRVVRFFQNVKQDTAIGKTLGVTYDEAGDEPEKIINNMKKLHDKGYVTDVFLVHPKNIASNLVQNFFRVVSGNDGGRDSSAAIVQAFKDIEAKKDIYVKNAEKTVVTPSKDLEAVKKELKNATVQDDETRGNKPIDVLAEIQPMKPSEAYKTFMDKLDDEKKDLLTAMLKYSALSLKDIPDDAKKAILDMTAKMSNKEATQVLSKAADSGKYIFKFGGVTPELVKKAKEVLV